MILAMLNVVAAICAFYFYHDLVRPAAPDLEKIEERVTTRLSAVTTAAEMQEAGRNLASLAANNARVMLSAQKVIDQALINLCGLGALNVALVVIGVWDAWRTGRAARNTPGLRETAG